MKTLFSLFSCAILSMAMLSSCESADKFSNNVSISGVDGNLGVKKEIAAVGKIYVKDNFIYVNEPGQGVHIVENTNPKNPTVIGFIKIEGNLDIAMKGDYAYADRKADLVIINMKTKQEKVLKNVFTSYKSLSDNQMALNGKADNIHLKAVQSYTPVNNGAGAIGTGGSMARFAIVDNFLYVIDDTELKVYDISNPDNPVFVKTNRMDATVETVFPYEDKLFIGGTDGMFIYDNSDASNPKLLSKFEHIVACDPVAVDNDKAYITLRNGTPCREQADNLLQIVDVKDPKNPTFIKEYAMHNPHGLSVSNNVLYVCDGNQGLKVYDVADANNIKVLSKATEVNKAYDVINLGHKNNLIVVGKDGIYQYDNSNPTKLEQLSKLEIYKAS